jgi:hypothetical protein
MSDNSAISVPVTEILDRYEDVIRRNEVLQSRVEHLNLAVGHTSELVNLARAVRRWRDERSDDAEAAMFAILDEYYRSRSSDSQRPLHWSETPPTE